MWRASRGDQSGNGVSCASNGLPNGSTFGRNYAQREINSILLIQMYAYTNTYTEIQEAIAI